MPEKEEAIAKHTAHRKNITLNFVSNLTIGDVVGYCNGNTKEF